MLEDRRNKNDIFIIKVANNYILPNKFDKEINNFVILNENKNLINKFEKNYIYKFSLNFWKLFF